MKLCSKYIALKEFKVYLPGKIFKGSKIRHSSTYLSRTNNPNGGFYRHLTMP